jgi:hypothetical protein
MIPSFINALLYYCGGRSIAVGRPPAAEVNRMSTGSHNDTILTGLCGIDRCSSHGHCRHKGNCFCLPPYIGASCQTDYADTNAYVIWQSVMSIIGISICLALCWRMFTICRCIYLTIINTNDRQYQQDRLASDEPVVAMTSPHSTAPVIGGTTLLVQVTSPMAAASASPIAVGRGEGEGIGGASAVTAAARLTIPLSPQHNNNTNSLASPTPGGTLPSTRPLLFVSSRQPEQHQNIMVGSRHRGKVSSSIISLLRQMIIDWRLQLLTCGLLATASTNAVFVTTLNRFWDSFNITFINPPFLFAGIIAVRMLLQVHAKFDTKTRKALPCLDVAYIIASLLTLITHVITLKSSLYCCLRSLFMLICLLCV